MLSDPVVVLEEQKTEWVRGLRLRQAPYSAILSCWAEDLAEAEEAARSDSSYFEDPQAIRRWVFDSHIRVHQPRQPCEQRGLEEATGCIGCQDCSAVRQEHSEHSCAWLVVIISCSGITPTVKQHDGQSGQEKPARAEWHPKY